MSDAEASKRLAAAIPPHVWRVCQTLAAAGYQAVAVGGAVRDAILGRTPGDWDVIDPYEGQEDLAEKRLRAVGPTGNVYGDAVARFTEDGLRVMRAVRFAATLEFVLDPDTERAIEPALPSLAKVSPGRPRRRRLRSKPTCQDHAFCAHERGLRRTVAAGKLSADPRGLLRTRSATPSQPGVLLDAVKKTPAAMALERRVFELVRGCRRYLMGFHRAGRRPAGRDGGRDGSRVRRPSEIRTRGWVKDSVLELTTRNERGVGAMHFDREIAAARGRVAAAVEREDEPGEARERQAVVKLTQTLKPRITSWIPQGIDTSNLYAFVTALNHNILRDVQYTRTYNPPERCVTALRGDCRSICELNKYITETVLGVPGVQIESAKDGVRVAGTTSPDLTYTNHHWIKIGSQRFDAMEDRDFTFASWEVHRNHAWRTMTARDVIQGISINEF